MSNYKKINLLNFLVLVLMVIFGFYMKQFLPAIIPTKFNEVGVAIKFAPIIASILFLPIFGTMTILFLTFVSKKNISFWCKQTNQQAVAQTNLGIILLLASLYIGTFLTALNFEKFFQYSYFSIGFGLFFVVSANPMKMIEKNLFYGIRVPWTMKSELNWKKTHELTAKLMYFAAPILLIAGFFTKSHILILSLVGMAFIIPMIYSFSIRRL